MPRPPRVATQTRGAELGKEDFRLAYVGPALTGGVMDVADLGPALVAAGSLCRQANRLLNGNRAEVSVQARARLRGGSFEFTLQLLQWGLDHGPELFTELSVKDVHYLLGVLGFAEAGKLVKAGASVFKIWKQIRGRRIVERRVAPNGMVNISVEGDNNQISVHNDVLLIVENPGAVRAAQDLVRPLDRKGVERLEVRRGNRVIEEVTRDDVPALAAVASTSEVSELGEEERTSVVQIVRPSFDENLQWEFDEGAGHFGAYLKDEGFLARVDSSAVAFTKGDILRVRLVAKKFQRGGRIVSEISIVQVLEERLGPRQQPLIARQSTEGVRPGSAPQAAKKKRRKGR